VIEQIKSLCVLVLLLISIAYFGVALYGQIAGNSPGAYYSEEIDATCVTDRDFGLMAMSCLPGDRFNLRAEKEQ